MPIFMSADGLVLDDCSLTVNHGYEDSVSVGVTCIFNNGNDVSSVSGHVDCDLVSYIIQDSQSWQLTQITSTAVTEFDSVDGTGLANDVGDMTDGSSAGSSKI